MGGPRTIPFAFTRKNFLIDINQKLNDFQYQNINKLYCISNKNHNFQRNKQNHISIIVINQMYFNCNNLFLNAIEGSGLFFPQKEKEKHMNEVNCHDLCSIEKVSDHL